MKSFLSISTEVLTKLVPGIRLTVSSSTPESDLILLHLGEVAGNNASDEIYKVIVSGKTVDISGKTIKGVFYGGIYHYTFTNTHLKLNIYKYTFTNTHKKKTHLEINI